MIPIYVVLFIDNWLRILQQQQQQALMPRKTVAEEDELKLMRAVERLEIINKTEPVRPIRRNIELPDKVFLLQYQVTDLESLVKDLRSQHRSDNPDDKTVNALSLSLSLPLYIYISLSLFA